MNSYKYPQNADDLVSHRYSLYQTVLLSYYQVSRCSLLIKTFPLCLIQATYCSRLSQKSSAYTFYNTGDIMSYSRTTQIVKVDLPMPRIIAKAVKYVMLLIITGSCLYSALVLHAIASRLL